MHTKHMALKMDRKRRRRKPLQKKFFISKEYDRTSKRPVTLPGDQFPMQSTAAFGDGSSDSVAVPENSENWRHLCQQLGMSTKRKRDTLPSASSLSVNGENTKTKQLYHSRRASKEVVPVVTRPRQVPTVANLTHTLSEREPMEACSRLPDRTHTCAPTSVGKCVSLDCEMVGTGPGGESSMLARCSVVNRLGTVLYDKFVAPVEKVTDYRTKFSGVKPNDLIGAPDFFVVQREVSDILKDKVLVGHSVQHDLKALLLSHPNRDIRDTSNYKPFRDLVGGRKPSLKKLAKELLGMDIHEQAHDSVEDASVAMRLYQLHKSDWELFVRVKCRKYKTRK